MGMALHEIQARRVGLLELVAESNEVGVMAVHAIMQEPNAYIQFAHTPLIPTPTGIRHGSPCTSGTAAVPSTPVAGHAEPGDRMGAPAMTPDGGPVGTARYTIR